MEIDSQLNEIITLSFLIKEGKIPDWKKRIIITSIMILFTVIAVLIIILIANSPAEIITNYEGEIIAEFVCDYDIEQISKKTTILGNGFIKNSDFDIYIDRVLIKFSKEYQFLTTGKHKIKL